MTIRTYSSPEAFKQALEQRLGTAAKSGAEFARKRQLLVFDRFLARVVDGTLNIDVECRGLEDDVAAHVRDVLQTLVHVERVDLDTYRRFLAA